MNTLTGEIMRVKLDHIDDIAKNIKMFWFVDGQPRNTAGQFIELRLPHEQPDKRGEKRWFTLTSSPTEGKFAITTKFAVESSSFKKTLNSLKPGAEVTMSEPMGDFVLPKDKSIPLVFVAGGIGITPMRSMTKWLLDTGEKRDLQLIYAANSLDEVAFKDLFEKYGAKLDIVLSTPPAGWRGESGRLSADKIIELSGGLDGKLVYLSGPEPMVEALDKDLKAKGVNRKHILADFFPGYAEV